MPGAAIGVIRHGAATTAYHGVADVRTGDPVTAETRFSVGSLTKSMVATVLARLAETGRLTLGDAVPAHVPELRGSGWAQRATLRGLLSNRSGLPLSERLEFGFADRTDADDGALARLTADAVAGPPMASFWSYSNIGWCVLGRVIETTTDDSWEDAMRRHLFEGAGMRRQASDGSRFRRLEHRGTTSRLLAPCQSSRWQRVRTGLPGPASSRPSRIFFASPPCIWRTPRLPHCVQCMPTFRSTDGSMPGVSAGPGSIGRAVRCGAGTASSAASGRFSGSCRSVERPSS